MNCNVNLNCKVNLNCNVNRPTVLVFYDAGKLKTSNIWNMDDQKTEVSNYINYLELILSSTGGCNKQKEDY